MQLAHLLNLIQLTIMVVAPPLKMKETLEWKVAGRGRESF